MVDGILRDLDPRGSRLRSRDLQHADILRRARHRNLVLVRRKLHGDVYRRLRVRASVRVSDGGWDVFRVQTRGAGAACSRVVVGRGVV